MSIMPQDPDSNNNTPTSLDHWRAATLVGDGPINHPELHRALIGRVAEALADERARVLNEARAVVERETDAYPGASPAITSGIWGGFDQWAAARIEHMPCPCGRCETQWDYDENHRNDEGGY